MTTPAKPTTAGRLPKWMRKAVPPPGRSAEVAGLLDELKLNTVCRSARCPNQSECFSRGTATFMILGGVCTRHCRFCAVPGGVPHRTNPDEPQAVAQAATKLGLRHVVITSVTRDDLPDGGAAHFASTIRAVREAAPLATIEVLTPDFAGSRDAVQIVLDAGPDVFNHNTETVPRLYPSARPQADYKRSLDVLAYAGKWAYGTRNSPRTKSGLMLGLGETESELHEVFADLRQARVSMLTLGQYLAPSPEHLPIARFVRPSEFDGLRSRALKMGFTAVAAGPYVRSSYMAARLLSSGR